VAGPGAGEVRVLPFILLEEPEVGDAEAQASFLFHARGLVPAETFGNPR
jgi:hypothetical protein